MFLCSLPNEELSPISLAPSEGSSPTPIASSSMADPQITSSIVRKLRRVSQDRTSSASAAQLRLENEMEESAQGEEPVNDSPKTCADTQSLDEDSESLSEKEDTSKPSSDALETQRSDRIHMWWKRFTPDERKALAMYYRIVPAPNRM